MAYSAPSSRSTSDLITAAIWNADVVANPIAIYAGAMSVTSQAVGDILYASSTTQLGRIAAVATGQVLTSAGTGTVPAWSSNVDLGGTLDVTGATTLDSTLSAVGNVGVGTTSPASPASVSKILEIESDTSAGLVLHDTAGNPWDLYADGTDFTIAINNYPGIRIEGDTGNVGIGNQGIAAGAVPGALAVNKDYDAACYFGKGFISSTATAMTADRAHFGHVDCESGTDYALVQTADGNTPVNCKTSQRIWFGINAGAIGNWNATGLRVGDATAASYKLDVNGSLNKTSGTFSIDHPLPSMRDTHRLVHSFVEGPRADLIYRGTATLSAGTVDIDMDEAAGMTPGTWVLLCRDEQCYTSNETGWHHVRGTVVGSTLTIDCEEECDDVISWMVVACRKDQHMYEADTLWTDDDGYPILEPLKPPSSASTSPSASASPSE